MDEEQLLEVLHMNTLTDESGKQHLFSVPITLPCTEAEKNLLQGEKRVALRCSEISSDH